MRTRTVGLARRLLAGGLLLGAVLGTPAAAPAGMIKSAVLSVNLKNPVAAGNSISALSFSVTSPNIGRPANIGRTPAGIRVSSKPGVDRYKGIGGVQAGLIVSFIGQDTVTIGLVPLQAYAAGDNVRFELTVDGTDRIRFESTLNGTFPPAWFDNSTPQRLVRPGPKLPAFAVVGDPQYFAFNDLEDPYAIHNLRFFPDITQAEFDAIDLDAVLAETPMSPGIHLSPGTFHTQFVSPDPQPGNLFVAVGLLLDSSGQVVGSFKQAVVTEVVPGPAGVVLVLTGLATVAAGRLRRTTRT